MSADQARVIGLPDKGPPKIHRCSFSMKSSISGRTLAATNDRHFPQVDVISRACRGFRFRLKKPWSEDEFRPLGGVLMAFLQFWVDDATEVPICGSIIFRFRCKWGYRGLCPESSSGCRKGQGRYVRKQKGGRSLLPPLAKRF